LNKNGNSGHPCLVPNLRKKAFTLGHCTKFSNLGVRLDVTLLSCCMLSFSQYSTDVAVSPLKIFIELL